MSEPIFPVDVFPLVEPKDYFKFDKVNFSEDFVGENFRAMNWDVYTPIQDKGIDRIIVKYVCEVDGHTQLNENLRGDVCRVNGCNKKSKKITRLIQIKTRKATLVKSTKSNESPSKDQTRFIGYTFKPKDFLTDPRICFLIYSDWTENFLIFPIYEFMELMKKNSKNHGYFKSASFKQGNDKKNNIRVEKKKWFLGEESLDQYVDSKGLEKISSYNLEKDIDTISKKILQIKQEDFLDIAHTGDIKNTLDTDSLKELVDQINSTKEKDQKYFANLIKQNGDFINTLDQDLRNSIAKYFENPRDIKIEYDPDTMDDDFENDEV